VEFGKPLRRPSRDLTTLLASVAGIIAAVTALRTQLVRQSRIGQGVELFFLFLSASLVAFTLVTTSSDRDFLTVTWFQVAAFVCVAGAIRFFEAAPPFTLDQAAMHDRRRGRWH
jgi:hypothetical protein